MKKILTFAAAVLFAASAMAQQAQPLPVDPAVRIGHLDNGLTYYIRHHEEPKGQANFYIAQKVGSILEDEEQRGLAHFLEHMCFNGTEHFPGNNVIKYCESIGVKFGENLNAYTSIDETVYNIDNVPVATTPSAIDSCLWILHDWADGLLLEADDIDHERGVIHEEWRSRMNQAQMRMYEKILPEMFPGNKYGERLPIGLMSVVDNFPYQVLRDYYEKWYRPDQQGIIVVGDVDVDEIEAKIKTIFGTIAKPENPAERYYVQIEDNAEPIVTIASDKEQPYALSYIFCKHEAYPEEMKNDLNYFLYDYALSAARIMAQARIQEMLQSPEPPFIDAAVGNDIFFIAKTKEAWTGTVASNDTDMLKALTTLYREMLRVVRNGFTASEYERAKADIIASYERAYNMRDKVKSSQYCSEYVQNFVNGEPIISLEDNLALIQQIAPAIPVEIVNQIVSSLVGEGNLAVACMLPEKEGVVYPTVDEIKAALAAVEAEDIQPYVDTVSDEPLISELPAKGSVLKSKDDKFGYRKYSLSNGATLYFKQTDFNADQIILHSFSRGGTSIYPESMSPVLKTVGELMNLGGVGAFSNTNLNKVLAGKMVGVSPYINTYEEGITATSTPKDIETMLQLCYLYFTAQRSDDDAFASWKTRARALALNRASQPMSAFQDTLTLTIYDHPERASELTVEEIDGMDYPQAMQIARERFAGADDFTFIVTGNIDEATLLPLVEQYIASLPSAGKKEKEDGKILNFNKGQISNQFDREMEIPMVTTCYLDSGKAKFNLKNSVAYDAALNALTNVLLEEIREKEGGTYSISANGTMSGSPEEEAYCQIAYQSDPDKYEYLNNRVLEIVDEFAQSGPTQENLDKAKEFFLKNYQENLRENNYWTNALKSYIKTGTDVCTDFEKTVTNLDIKTVKKVFNSIYKQGNHSEIIMKGVPQTPAQ